VERPGRGDGDDAPVVEVQLAVTGDGVESALRRERPDAGIVVVEVAVLAEEIVRDAPGQQVMLDRLLDVLLVSTLRRWFTGLAEEAPRGSGRRTTRSSGPRCGRSTTTRLGRGPSPSSAGRSACPGRCSPVGSAP